MGPDDYVIHAIRHRAPAPPMALGLIQLRGVPLSSAARPLAALFERYFQGA